MTDNASLHRFELPIAEGAHVENGRVVLVHTEVPQEFSRHGIESPLARGTFELIRETGRKAVLECPFNYSAMSMPRGSTPR